MGWRGLLAGALGLAFLELVLKSPQSPGRLGDAASGAGDVVRRFLSPAVPLFSPDTPKSSSGATPSMQPIRPSVPSYPIPGQVPVTT